MFTCLGTMAFGAVGNFKDVSNNAWYKDAVIYTSEKGIISGTSATTFSPNDPITRGQFVTILGRMEGVDTSKYGIGGDLWVSVISYPSDSFEGRPVEVDSLPTFKDVGKKEFYTPYVYWAARIGVVNRAKQQVAGKPVSSFEPNRSVTREEMATMIANYLNAKNKELNKVGASSPTFADINKVSSWARPNVELLQDYGLLTGDSANRVNPKDSMTRAEAATVFTKLHKAIGGEKIEVPSKPNTGNEPATNPTVKNTVGEEWDQIRNEYIYTNYKTSTKYTEPQNLDMTAFNKELTRLFNVGIDKLNAYDEYLLLIGRGQASTGMAAAWERAHFQYDSDLQKIAEYAADLDLSRGMFAYHDYYDLQNAEREEYQNNLMKARQENPEIPWVNYSDWEGAKYHDYNNYDSREYGSNIRENLVLTITTLQYGDMKRIACLIR